MIKKQFEVALVHSNNEKLVVKPTTYKLEQELKTFYAISYRKSISMGVATRASMLEILKREGVWGDKEEESLTKISTEIGLLELDFNKSLAQNHPMEKKKELALKLARARTQLYTLVQIKSAPLSHTAEAIAEECKIDKIVSSSTFYEDGRPYFKDHEEFTLRRNEKDVMELYDAVITEMSKENAEFLMNLPENKWLVENGMMDKSGEMDVEHYVKILQDSEVTEEPKTADLPVEPKQEPALVVQSEPVVKKPRKKKDTVELNG